MRAVAALGLIVLALSSPGKGAPRSPLDLNPTYLAQKADGLPKGLEKAKDCFNPYSPGCTLKAPGISYYIDEDRVGIIEMSKVRGRFLQSLPLGLTGEARNADVRKAYRPFGIMFKDDEPDGSVISSFDLHMHGFEIAWLEFHFGKDGRLSKASLHTDLTSD